MGGNTEYIAGHGYLSLGQAVHVAQNSEGGVDQQLAQFLEKRLELAQHEGARMKANDSLECRNCHASVAMDFQKQTQRAAEIHSRYLLPGKATCIDCHKGIAHELPNMDGVDPGWKMPKELEGKKMARQTPIDDLREAVQRAHLEIADGAD